MRHEAVRGGGEDQVVIKLKEPGAPSPALSVSKEEKRMQLYHRLVDHAWRLPYVTQTIPQRFE